MNEKKSIQYENYRQAVEEKRRGSLADDILDNDKYDPADILNEDEDDGKNAEELYNERSDTKAESDDYDSDSEYRQETKQRNYANMKKKLDSLEGGGSFLGNQYDSSDEDEHMEMYKKIQIQESGGGDDDNDDNDDDDEHDDNVDNDDGSNSPTHLNRPYFEMSKDANDDVKPSRRTDKRSSDSEPMRKRKRSRWGEKVEGKPQPQQPPALMSLNIPVVAGGSASFGNQKKPVLSAVTRTDPVLLNYARLNYGTTNLSEEDWKKCEDHYKINLLYQDMLQKRNEIDRLAKSGKFKYEYDSDEDVTGGTWEHKLRNAEMEATEMWADALTKQSEGKHHIGDFLPPEELKKFMEQYDSSKMNREPDLSDYKEYKLREDNKGMGIQILY